MTLIAFFLLMNRSIRMGEGSGFKSLHPYQSGYFSAAVKLQPGYTAGVITSFYVKLTNILSDHYTTFASIY